MVSRCIVRERIHSVPSIEQTKPYIVQKQTVETKSAPSNEIVKVVPSHLSSALSNNKTIACFKLYLFMKRRY
ncbi:hypothetical protein VCHA50O413_30184 [Vibrio chagasii]|nr:hypothetical protein VCHA27O13_10655 [Vibrio chagasii]CAH6845418.1 hypothetical protein VCHA31O71_10452 [Vibrio chagasii]CAH6846634.1 hypothetical protein VCHA34P131_10587 [Vibrio chagasii]CAH6850335.1 hypothetical protein VCHA32P90_10682 [Vibrio chagasii]CAH6855260.1 hypothetical protein VCHA34P116_10683 [Vibrio chagasii]